jgi:hypothetical protein
VPQKETTKARPNRNRDAAEGTLRSLVEGALVNSAPDAPTSMLIVASLSVLAREDDERLAVEMAKTAIDALVGVNPEARRRVREWDAHRRACDDLDSNALKLLHMAQDVETAALLYRVTEPRFVHKGRAAVERLRDQLVKRLGATVPDVDELEDWIGRCAPKAGRGKLTTAGIVTRIVHRGRLLGARGEDEQKTLKRVDNVLSRHRSTPHVE